MEKLTMVDCQLTQTILFSGERQTKRGVVLIGVPPASATELLTNDVLSARKPKL